MRFGSLTLQSNLFLSPLAGYTNLPMRLTVRELGGLDVLINIAGRHQMRRTESMTDDEWTQDLAVNLNGPFHLCRAALPYLLERGGNIVNVSSIAGVEGQAYSAGYCAAKHGLIGLAKVVAKEGAQHGVRANVICPGFVRTPLVDRQIPEQARLLGLSEQTVIQNIMLRDTIDGQFTTVEDIAEVAMLFASFPSNALTGQSLVVSHGWHMQ